MPEKPIQTRFDLKDVSIPINFFKYLNPEEAIILITLTENYQLDHDMQEHEMEIYLENELSKGECTRSEIQYYVNSLNFWMEFSLENLCDYLSIKNYKKRKIIHKLESLGVIFVKKEGRKYFYKTVEDKILDLIFNKKEI